MAQFAYKAKSGPQNLVSGYIEAESVAQAVSKLMQEGHIPVEVKPSDKPLGPSPAKLKGPAVRVPRPALVAFTRQLADLLEAGIPLLRCLELIAHQRQFPAMLPVVTDLIGSLRHGGSFSYALAQHPQVFSPLFVNTVIASEASGKLPLAMERLAQFLERDMHNRAKTKASLLYPAIILGVGILTIFVLLSFVLPRLTSMFEDFGAALPLMTQTVVALAGVFERFWWLILSAAIGIFAWFKYFISTPAGKLWADTIVLKVPFLGPFIENVQLSRFARTLAMLIESGVPVTAALEFVTSVVDNVVLQKEVRTLAVRVREGMSLTQAVKASTFFPEITVDLITVGQETGKLEKGLYKLAAGCERNVEESGNAFITILGPAVLVIVVGIVGFMIVAMLLPIFQMNLIVS